MEPNREGSSMPKSELGRQGSTPRKGPAGARTESRDNFLPCVPFGAHLLPSVFPFQAPEQRLRESPSSWMHKLPLPLPPSLKSSIQETALGSQISTGHNQDSLNPGIRTVGRWSKDRERLEPQSRRNSWICLDSSLPLYRWAN